MRINVAIFNQWEQHNPDPDQEWPCFARNGKFLGTVNGDGFLETTEGYTRQVKFDLADIVGPGYVEFHEAAYQIAVLDPDEWWCWDKLGQ